MQITALTPQLAPLATGHPLALPARVSPATPAVPPAGDTDTAATGDQRGRPPMPPSNPEAILRNPEDHVAPPSIMQLKIAAMQNAAQDAESPAAAPEEDPMRGADTTDSPDS